MRAGTAAPIAEVIKSVVEKLNHRRKKPVVEIASLWPKVAGNKLARHSRVVSLKKGTLIVCVDESAWLFQVNLQKAKLLQALQEKVGGQKVQRIQFRIGNR